MEKKRISASCLAPLAARELKGKRQFCSIVLLDEEDKVLQRLRFDKKQMPGKLHVEDYIFSSKTDLKHLSKKIKTVIVASVNSFCLSGNKSDKSRSCCMDVLAKWHKENPGVRLILVYKKPYEIDKSLSLSIGCPKSEEKSVAAGRATMTFEKYLTNYFYSKFDSEFAELLKWDGESASLTK